MMLFKCLWLSSILFFLVIVESTYFNFQFVCSCFKIEDKSISCENGKLMDNSHLRLMVLMDDILTLKKLEGKTIYEF